jgi:hypothetical protein
LLQVKVQCAVNRATNVFLVQMKVLAMNSKVEKGFKFIEADNSEIKIEYRATGNAPILIFLAIVCSGLLWVIHMIIFGDKGWWLGELKDQFSNENYLTFALMSTMFVLAFSCGVAACFWGIYFCLRNLFGNSVFEIRGEYLAVEDNLFFLKRRKGYHLDQIKGLAQEKDGGEEDDSFPSYALVLYIEDHTKKKNIYLLKRQNWQKSNWLGRTLAEALNVKFTQIKHLS